MSAVTNIFVTPSTSLVLIKNISTPTNVYLSNLYAPNFSLTVRDTTGLSSIATSSVRISTIGSARFLDGTHLYLLDKPYGLVNIALRNSTIWQILHTSGQAPAAAAANVTTLNVSSLYLSFLSSAIKQISTLTVNDFVTIDSFSLNSTFVLQNLSAPGFVAVQSTLNVYGNAFLNGSLFVSGPAQFLSSVTVGFIRPISSSVRVISSVGVGSNLSVGGTVTVGSTLHTYSTNTVQSIQIQKSTSLSVFEAGQLQVQNLVSSLLSVTASQLFTTASTLRISQNISTLSGIFSTRSLDVTKEATVQQSLSTFGNAVFFSTLQVASSFTVSETALVSTNLRVLGDAYASSFSTMFLSSLGSLSTGNLYNVSSMNIHGGLSTAIVQGFGWIELTSSFTSPGVLSSLRLTTVTGEINVHRDVLAGSFHGSTSVGVGGDLIVGGNAFFGTATFNRSLSTLGGDVVTGPADIVGNVGVKHNVFVDTYIRVRGGSQISSFFVNSFLLSNLEILTSSPFLSFSASSFVGSNIQTRQTQILPTNPAPFVSFSTFASTTQFTLAVAETTLVNTVRASNVAWGNKQTSLSANSQPQFVINTNSFFAQGLSSMNIRAGTLNANTLDGAFLGNGAGISNVAVPYANLSGFTMIVSTLSTSLLSGSSFFASSFIGFTVTDAVSSFITSTLNIRAIGFPTSYSTNQILSLTSNSMVVNRSLYFARLNNRIGLNVSSPAYDFDIPGTMYASNVAFSSFSFLNISSFSTITLSSVTVSSATVRDLAFYATKGIEVFSRNRTATDPGFPFEIRTLTGTTPSTFGIYSYPSSIGLNNSFFIYNDSRKVVLSGYSNGVFRAPVYDFNAGSNLSCVTGYFSSVNVKETVQSETFFSPSLRIQYPITISTNVFSTTERSLIMNNILTVDNSSTTRIGVKTTAPNTNLDVRGNAYFSSIEFVGIGLGNFLSLGSQTL